MRTEMITIRMLTIIFLIIGAIVLIGGILLEKSIFVIIGVILPIGGILVKKSIDKDK